MAKGINWRYPLARQVIDKSDIENLIYWLRRSQKLTMGAMTQEFERQWAKKVGTKFAVFCNSGSSANLLMAYALMVSKKLANNKAIVPSTGWATSVAPFMQFGYSPIMCGSDEKTFALDFEHLEFLIKKHKPAVVVLVHVLGVPAYMDKILSLKRKYNFFLLEDACGAVGAKFADKNVGSFGDMGSFSFYFGHQLSTIEGGMVNTDSRELYELMLILRSHGWGKDLPTQRRRALARRYKINDYHDPFIFFLPGFNLRPTDLAAALGISQLAKAEKIFAIRHKNHLTYSVFLKGLEYQKWSGKSYVCSISFAAIAKDGEHRRKIVEQLDKHLIETRIFSAGNLGLHPFWFESFGKFHHRVSDKLFDCGFFLPNNESMDERDVQYVIKVVNSVKYGK